MTLAFSINFMPFSGWSRFTMTWMPARDSLPSHYVSVYWLQLRDLIFNDRCFGLRVVGTLKFHHLCDLLSVGINWFPLFPLFSFLGSVLRPHSTKNDWQVCLNPQKEISVILTYRLEERRGVEKYCTKSLQVVAGYVALLFSTLMSSCSGESQACTWSPMMHLYAPKRICVRADVSMWRANME